VNLWLFNHEEAVLNYRKSGARISKIHFNDSGSKFGYCDFGGVLSLWRFNSSPDGLHRPYVVRHNTMVIHRCCWYPNNLSLSLSLTGTTMSQQTSNGLCIPQCWKLHQYGRNLER